MSQSTPELRHSNGLKALALLEEALETLDAADLPENIGAHVDLAICRLRELLQSEPKD